MRVAETQCASSTILMSDFERGAQSFHYGFSPDSTGKAGEVLHFKTFTKDCEATAELDEIKSIYGDKSIMYLTCGAGFAINSLQEAIHIRNVCREKTSLVGPESSIMWKVYCQKDPKMDRKSFIGFVELIYEEKDSLLQPFICLRKEYQRKGLGTKALLCLLAKVLECKKWLSDFVQRDSVLYSRQGIKLLSDGRRTR